MEPAHERVWRSYSARERLGAVEPERPREDASGHRGRPAARASGGRGRSGAGVRASAGTGTRRRAPRRRRSRRTPRPASAASARSVFGSRRRASRRPCTICSSCTANSTSRIPPRPRFTSVPALPAGAHVLLEPDLHLADLVDRPRFELLRVHERLDRASTNAAPSSGSPATGRALMSACRSHVAACVGVVLAHRVERPGERAGAPARTQGGVDAERDPLDGGLGQAGG